MPLQHSAESLDSRGGDRPAGIGAFTRGAAHVDFRDRTRPNDLGQHLVVDTTAGDDGEAGAGARRVGAQSLAPRRRRAFPSARQDPVDASDGCQRVDRTERVTQLVERPVESDVDVRGSPKHVRQVVQLGLPRTGESARA